MSWLDKLFRFGGAASVPVADSSIATVVPEADSVARLIVLTGPLTADRSVILPLEAGADWTVKNQTTGGRTVTVRGPSGVGVAIPPDGVRSVVCTGSRIDLPSMGPTEALETADHWTRHQLIGVYSHTLATSALETIATLNVTDYLAGAVTMAVLLSAEIAVLSDDGMDVWAYAVKGAFHYNSGTSTLGPVGAIAKTLEGEAAPASCDVDLAVSGTNIAVKVGGLSCADFRTGCVVRATFVRFS